MKLQDLLLTIAIFAFAWTNNAQNFDWVTAVSAANSQGLSIDTDPSGNVYTTGYFSGTANVPGGTVPSISSLGYSDAYVAKLDSSGNFQWLKQFGGVDYVSGLSIAVSANGNSYITGRFEGTADFDPGPGTAIFTTYGSDDTFITKLDSAGNFVWAKQFGGTNYVRVNSIAIDEFENVYTTGYFFGTADFDPGSGTVNLIPAGSVDVFVSKLDESGNFIWAKQLGGTSSDKGSAITVDILGNVYTTGEFRGTSDFDPGPGTSELTSAGSGDIFVSKLDVSGNFVWAKRMGGTTIDEARSIAVDALGNVYSTGDYYGLGDYDPGPGVFNLYISANDYNCYISKLDAAGDFVWAKQIGGNGDEFGFSIALDASNNVYTTGRFEGNVDFDPGPGIETISSTGGATVFISKLDTDGNYLWAGGFGGSLTDIGNNIAIDPFWNIYTTGIFSSTVDFDPGLGSSFLYAGSNVRSFIHKMSQCDNTGTDVQITCDPFTWIDGNTYTESNYTATHILTNAGGCDSLVTLNLTNNSSTGVDIQTACDSYIWIDGFTYTASNNTATYTIPNAANCDSLISLDLTIKNSTTGIDVQSACDTYTWIDGNTYTTSNNTATHVLTNSINCDSLVTLNLTITNSSTGIDTQTDCDSYTWIDGNTYTTNNTTATHTLTNAASCDSIITLNLTINNSTTGIDVQTTCDSYTWIDGNTYTVSNNTATHTLINTVGCDSLVTLNLTVNNNSSTDFQSACDTYTWIDGNTYTTSNNTATHILTNAAGCDSVVMLNLTINNTPEVSTSISGITITANNSTATYQWLDCNNSNAQISGENNQSYTPTTNGSYAVELNNNGCIDTSVCVSITTVGIIESDFGSGFLLYPNPTNGQFSIDMGKIYNIISVNLTDLNGKIIHSQIFNNTQLIDLSLDEPAGVYLLNILSGESKAIIRLVKK